MRLLPAALLATTLGAFSQSQPPPKSRDGEGAISASALLDKGDYAGAASVLEKTAAAKSRNPEIYLMLAVARLNLRSPDGAAQACDDGLKSAPGSSRLENYCAALFLQIVPKPDRAARLELALKTNSKSGPLQKALGKALLESSPEDPRVGTVLEGAASALPRDPDAHYSYGEWACMHQRTDTCIAEMRKALSLADASNYRARLGANTFIAMTEEGRGNLDAAARAYQAALDANRKLEHFNPDPAFLYAKFLQAKDDAAAGALVEEILQRAPGFAPARFERAKALFRDGSPDKAAAEAEQALSESRGEKTELRAIHSFLVKAYSVLGREIDAAAHQAWVEANRR